MGSEREKIGPEEDDGSVKPEGWSAPTPDYGAAHLGLAVAARENRRFLRVSGRVPGDMLRGILSGRIPEVPSPWLGASTPGSDGAEAEGPVASSAGTGLSLIHISEPTRPY